MIQMRINAGLSWGGKVGLDMVEDKEVEVEEEDLKVAQIFNDVKHKH